MNPWVKRAVLRAGVAVSLLVPAASGVPAAMPAPEGEAARRVESFPPERVLVEGFPLRRVRLSVSVVDRQGHPVKGLEKSDFTVEEDGERQELVDFGREFDRQDRPLSAVFLVDRSGSIGRQMAKWKLACSSLLGVLRPIDQVSVRTFADEVELVQEFTHDPEAIASAVDRIGYWGRGGTRVFSALDETLRDLRRRPGRKVIFLLTDGLGERIGEGPVSGRPFLEDLAARAVLWQVTVVTILPGASSRPYLAVQDLAIQTGGWWLYPSDDLPGLVQRLGTRLLESYFLAYDSSRQPGDRSRRAVVVKIRRAGRPGLRVTTATAAYPETPLLDSLAEDLAGGEEDERVLAATFLGGVRDKKTIKWLRRALGDDSDRVRAAAIASLARRGAVTAVGRIARFLRDEDEEVRRAAVSALQNLLGKACDERTRTRILDALETADEDP
ncbi:MAG: VWA domain-containing protein [Acidobacteriota bacterium]